MRLWSIGFIAVLFALGCSKGMERSATPEPTVADELTEVAGMLRDFTARVGRGPTRLSELAEEAQLYPRGYEAIRSGSVVVVWGVVLPMTGGSGSVIAYQSQAPTAGGVVVLQNGEVKQMSASDFASAGKAS